MSHTQTMFSLAKTLERAVQIHEESWNPGLGKYDIPEVNAVHNACRDTGFNHPVPILLLITSAWNDSQDWARELIESVEGPRKDPR